MHRWDSIWLVVDVVGATPVPVTAVVQPAGERGYYAVETLGITNIGWPIKMPYLPVSVERSCCLRQRNVESAAATVPAMVSGIFWLPSLRLQPFHS